MTVFVRPYRGTALWEIDIKFDWPDGKPYRERLKSKLPSESASRRWGEQRERELWKLGQLRATEETRPGQTFAEFWPTYLEIKKVEGRKHSYLISLEQMGRTWLVPCLGNYRLADINSAVVSDQLLAKMQERSKKTRNNVVSVLPKFFKAAVERSKITGLHEVPDLPEWEKVDDAKQPDAYDEETAQKLIAVAKTLTPAHYICLLLACDAGLRRGEIAALRKTSVLNGNLIVSEAEYAGETSTTKGGRTRLVPMTQRLREAIEAHQDDRGPLLLYSKTGKCLTESVVKNYMTSIEYWAGLRASSRTGVGTKGRVHKLRHTFCSLLASKGVPSVQIQSLAGHRDAKTTSKYMHAFDPQRKAAIEKLEELAG